MRRPWTSLVLAAACLAAPASAWAQESTIDLRTRDTQNPAQLSQVVEVLEQAHGYVYTPTIRYEERVMERLRLNPELLKASGQKVVVPGATRLPADAIEAAARAVVSVTCGRDVASGFFVRGDGLIITNEHVVRAVARRKTACQIGITDDVMQTPWVIFKAKVLASDRDLDLAVLQISGGLHGSDVPGSFPFIETADSDALSFGDEVGILGYPLAGFGTVTYEEGSVSGRLGDDFLKLSANMDTGDSGGAVVDPQGKLVGVASFVAFGSYKNETYMIGSSSLDEWLEKIEAKLP